MKVDPLSDIHKFVHIDVFLGEVYNKSVSEYFFSQSIFADSFIMTFTVR